MIKRRFIPFILSFSLILGAVSYRPQEADAIVADAVIISSVAVILTSIGISYWASSQSEASDYIARKLQDYFSSLSTPPESYQEWLEIYSPEAAFKSLAGGVLKFGAGVANKILDFARWLQADESIVANGRPVGDFESLYTVRLESSSHGDLFLMRSSDSYNLSFSNFYRSSISDSYSFLYLPLTQDGYYTFVSLGLFPLDNKPGYFNLGKSSNLTSWTLVVGGSIPFDAGTQRSGTWSDSPYLVIRINTPRSHYTGEWQFTLDAPIGLLYNGAMLNPSSSISIPENIDDGEALVVSTNAAIDANDSPDTASQAVFDAITSADGLTSSPDVVASAPSAWIWLEDIFTDAVDILRDIYHTVIGIPSAIAQGVSDLLRGIGSAITEALQAAFVPREAFITEYVAALNSNWDNHFSILSYPFSVLGRFITLASQHQGNYIFTWDDIHEPFSQRLLIGAGSYDLTTSLSNSAFLHAYELYLIVIKGYIVFWYFGFLYSWFCDVFHMHNSDFDAPSEENDYGEAWYD